jgi:IS5 family transposase
MSFAQVEYGAKKKLTRRDIFLAKMETVVPWARLEAHDLTQAMLKEIRS